MSLSLIFDFFDSSNSSNLSNSSRSSRSSRLSRYEIDKLIWKFCNICCIVWVTTICITKSNDWVIVEFDELITKKIKRSNCSKNRCDFIDLLNIISSTNMFDVIWRDDRFVINKSIKNEYDEIYELFVLSIDNDESFESNLSKILLELLNCNRIWRFWNFWNERK